MQLQIDAVHQPQRLEFFFGQFAGKPARHLIAEFRDALGDQRAVEGIVNVHGARLYVRSCSARVTGRSRRGAVPNGTGSSIVGPRWRINSRKLPGRGLPVSVSLTG